jgi:hypothetical protein
MSWKYEKQSPLPPIWNKIFKDDSAWLREMEELKVIKPTTLPTLVGWDLNGVLHGDKPSHIVLLVHDWSGELRYAEGALLESLRSFRYVNEGEVHIPESGITLNIAECLGHSSKTGQVRMKDPSKVFKRKNHQLYTSVLYYGDDTVHELGPESGTVSRCDSPGRKDWVCPENLVFKE